MRILSIFLLGFLTSCTSISITIVRTEGQASDVVDAQQSQSPTADVNADLSIPAAVLP